MHFCRLKYYFTHFIFTKIIKIVASGCHILKLKCIKFDFDWGSASDPIGELIALTALPGGEGARCPLPKDPTPCELRPSNNFY